MFVLVFVEAEFQEDFILWFGQPVHQMQHSFLDISKCFLDALILV